MGSFAWISRGVARLLGRQRTRSDNTAQRPDATLTVPAHSPETTNVPAAEPSSPRMPVDARGLALGILATLAILFALEWAQRFVVPVLLAILLAYTLNPLVVWLTRIRIRRSIGAILVMLAGVGVCVSGSYPLRDQIDRVVEQLPAATRTFS
ncbi:MAG: AI-2E family transporter, partial [Pandoraea sp.]